MGGLLFKVLMNIHLDIREDNDKMHKNYLKTTPQFGVFRLTLKTEQIIIHLFWKSIDIARGAW